MRSIRQLLRQPIKTLAGILLTAIAVAVLCVSISQTLAAADTSKRLLETYITVALSSQVDSQEKIDWLNSLAETHPELVKAQYSHGLASAYIPSLIPETHTMYKDGNLDVHTKTYVELQPDQLSYSGIMLEFQVESCEYSHYQISDPADPEILIDITDYSISGKVLQVIGITEGHPDPTGFTAKFTIQAETENTPPVAVGDYIMLYGENYNDNDWNLRNSMLKFLPDWTDRGLPDWDLSTLEVWDHPYDSNAAYTCKIHNLIHGLTKRDMKSFRTIYIQGVEYTTLEGSAEEFLASQEGALWRDRLAEIQINSQAFPVIGTSQLSRFGNFALGQADIIDGRDFTEAEIASGARVCILSKYVAERSGVKLGDTIDVQYFDYDALSENQQRITMGEAIVNPRAYTYHDGMTMTEASTYTIIGIYDQDSPWGSVEYDLYSFTPNTIFVPQASVTGDMDFAPYGQFTSLELHSDKLEEMQQLARNNAYDGIFQYYDNSYHVVASALEEFEAAALQVLPIGLTVYALLMFLYIFLFPCREKAVLVRMDSLGGNLGRQLRHMLLHTLGILIPGTLIGTLAAINLWDYVAQALKTYMDADIQIILDTQQLWIAAGAQALAVTLLCSILGLIISRGVNYMSRK